MMLAVSRWSYLLTLERTELSNVTLCHPGLTCIFNFRHSGTLALRAEHQSARMSEIDHFYKCNHLVPLHFKGLTGMNVWMRCSVKTVCSVLALNVESLGPRNLIFATWVHIQNT